MNGLVTTREAAQLYGCSESHLTAKMKDAGIQPMRQEENGAFRRYFWSPSDVLAVRKNRLMRQQAAQALLVARSQSASLMRGVARMRSKEARMEKERLKYLTQAAKRKGTTVAKLVIALGIPMPYRVGPT